MQGKGDMVIDMQLTEVEVICSREHEKLVLHSFI